MEIKDRELQVYNIITGLQCYFESNSTALDFINSEEVKCMMKDLKEFYSTKDFYNRFVKLLIDNYVSNPSMQASLYEVFKNSTDLRIYNYRHYLIYKGHCKYDYYKEKKNIEDNSNLSANLINELLDFGIDFVSQKYHNTLQEIADINKIDVKRLYNMLNNLIITKNSNDRIEYSNIIVSIKEYIKKYNAKVKERYSTKYAIDNMDSIKQYFEIKKSKNDDSKLLESIVKDYVQRNDEKLTNIIEAKFGKYIDDELLYTFVSNFLAKDDANFELLEMVEPAAYKESELYDTYERLLNNYYVNLNAFFKVEDLPLIKEFLIDKKNVCCHFSKKQKRFLNDMKPLLKKAKTELYNDNGYINFKTSLTQPTENERIMVDDYVDKLMVYNNLKNSFHKFKNENSDIDVKEDKITDLFNDSNYSLKLDYDYLKSFEFIARVIDRIDNDEIIKCNYEEYSEFLSDIIPCFLVSGDDKDIDFLANFFNYINRVPKNTHFKIHELTNAYKMISLYKYIEPETIDILGDEVCRKIVFNNQFIDVKYNDSDIKKRLEKAVFVMSKAHDITHSSIPYFDDIVFDNITIRRYNNVDSRTLTSGIDTNTCFKLDANDNDYLIYSLLSNNGLIVEILENGVMCGRITATLYYNVLILNGIRNVKNEYTSSSLEEINTNSNIIKAVELMANKLIELTKDSECPIDHVCCNMAGILESNEFWQDKQIIDVIQTPIDTLNDDYKNFKELFREHPEYLSQIDINSSESNYGQAPFTTDFGSYPLVLIASREGKHLDRKWDIAYNVQPPVYERPTFIEYTGTGYLGVDEIKLCKKINALHVYKNNHLDMDDTKIYVDLSKKFKSYYITETKAVFELLYSTPESTPIVYKI